jgi:SAM-dependent methyltransferase
VIADYASVTEQPGGRTTREGLSRAYSSYRFAREFCGGRDVLEIACGAGGGLGYLRSAANRIVAGDYTLSVLRAAQAQCRGSIPLLRFDAHHIPFAAASFDVVIVQQALYYFRDARAVFAEIRRVLRRPGTLVLTTVNPERADFHPSPFSTDYPRAADLTAALAAAGFDAELFGGFEDRGSTLRARTVSALKRIAVKFGIMPGSLRAREPLKRLFLGPLLPFPATLTDGMAEYDPPRRIEPAESSPFRILYAVARPR